MWYVLRGRIMYSMVITVYSEIFAGEIFRGLNFRGVKFSLLKPSTKIWRHENFATCTLTVCLMDMAAEFRKKLCVRGYHVYNNWQTGILAYFAQLDCRSCTVHVSVWPLPLWPPAQGSLVPQWMTRVESKRAGLEGHVVHRQVAYSVREPSFHFIAHVQYLSVNYSWWQNFRGFNFRSWGDPRKFEHHENFYIR